MSEWLALSETITKNLCDLSAKHDHSQWLLHSMLAKVEKMVTDIDTFVKDMTTKMSTMEAGIASLRPFIQGLFDQIAKIPGLTTSQIADLGAIEAKVDADAAAIAAAMGPSTPAV